MSRVRGDGIKKGVAIRCHPQFLAENLLDLYIVQIPESFRGIPDSILRSSESFLVIPESFLGKSESVLAIPESVLCSY